MLPLLKMAICISYMPFTGQYKTLMTQINLIADLSHLGIITVSGEGAAKLLQGQLTCDIDELSPGKSILGAQCNPQGRIISLFRIFIYRDQYHLLMPRELLPIAHAALKKYAVFFKAILNDISDSLTYVGYQGASAEIKKNDDTLILEFAEENSRGIIINPASPVKNFSLNPEEWKALDIAAGIPAIYPETSEKFLPHEINLQKINAISFTKGCYTGQEIIARMQYRGKLKNHMYRARVQTNTPPKHGDEITNATHPCGTIVDQVKIDDKTYELLVITPMTDVISDTVFLEANNKLEFLDLPYTL
jgi:folate-binding protein YgfZ